MTHGEQLMLSYGHSGMDDRRKGPERLMQTLADLLENGVQP